MALPQNLYTLKISTGTVSFFRGLQFHAYSSILCPLDIPLVNNAVEYLST